MSEWRPPKEEWEETKFYSCMLTHGGGDYCDIDCDVFEAGADAILEALKARGIEIPATKPGHIDVPLSEGRKGWLVFIPETGQKGDKGDNDTQQEKTPS